MGIKGAKLTEEATLLAKQLVEDLSDAGDITSKKMFGGHGIFESGTMFGLVNSKAEAYFKADDSNRSRFEEVNSHQHGKMPYFNVPEHILKDKDKLLIWAKDSIELSKK